MQSRIERLLQAQAVIRLCYRTGEIVRATAEYNSVIRPALCAVDPRVRKLALRLSKSFIQMVDDDLLTSAQA
jgi:hypothetical protein